MMKGILLLLFVSTFWSCQNEKDLRKEIYSIPLEAEISKGNMKNESFLNNLSTTLIPLELTELSLLGNCHFVEDILGRIVIHDYQHIYTFDNKNGTFLSRIAHQGEGPEDYINISDVVVHPKDSCIFILDAAGKKINIYSLNSGNLKYNIPNDSVASFHLLDNEKWITHNSPMEPFTYDICIHDSLQQKGKGIYNRENEVEHKGIIFINDFICSNNTTYIYKNDTLHQISNQGKITPFCHIDKGALSIPYEIATDVTQKAKRNSYIWGETICFTDTYCFLSYYYNQKMYFDVWNIHTGSLCYRNIAESANDMLGLPLKIGDETIVAWPKKVINDTLYCIASNENSENGEEENPCVLKIKINETEHN